MTVSNGFVSPLVYAVMNERFSSAFKRQVSRIASKFKQCIPGRKVTPSNVWPQQIQVIVTSPPATPEVFHSQVSKTTPEASKEKDSNDETNA